MKCQHCEKNEATFYMKRTVNGRSMEAHLCHRCAEELGCAAALPRVSRSFFRDPFALLREDWFGGLTSGLLTEFPAPGNTLDEARETVQRKETDNLLGEEERCTYDLQRRRNALQYQLQSAVAAENYEEAARLRDELRALPKE